LWLLATLNNGKPVTPSEAAKNLGVTLAAITHRINSLEEQGYVVRSPSPDDRRVVFISLSSKGAEMLDTVRKGYFEKIRGLVEYLGEEDSSVLIALLAKISDYVKKTGGN
jgi:DNA-binding MarR family transcriptional regulator